MINRHGLRCLWALLATVLVIGVAQAAEPQWRMLETPRYTVYSQLTDKETREWAGEFDQFIAALVGLLKLNPRTLTPLTVVLFDRDKDFVPYKPARPNGTIATNVAGFFYRTDTWGAIGMSEKAEDAQTRQTIFHEGVHWVLSGDRSPQPTWFSEGIAELFSTFGVKGQKVHWGEPIGYHLALLQESRTIPMEEFLTRQGSLFEKDSHTDIYYAQSWAFVHYLLLGGKADRREQLVRFLKAYQTQSAKESIAASFGDDAAGLEKELRSYTLQSRFGYGLTPRQPTDPLGNIVPASPHAVEAALGKLSLGATDPELARGHAAKAIALSPEAPAGHELLAYVAGRDEDKTQALASALHALRTGSRDPAMFIAVGDSMRPEAHDGSQARARRRADLYENAINLNPTSLRSYERLADALQDLPKPTEGDLKFLSTGRAIYPQAGTLQIAFAQLAHKDGQLEPAVQQIDAVLKPGSSLDESERAQARQLRTTWLMDDLQQRVTPLMNQHRYSQVREAIDAVRPRIDDGDARDYLASLSRVVDQQELVSQADSALRDGRIAEARKIYEQLLADAAVDSSLRDYAQRALETLKRRR